MIREWGIIMLTRQECIKELEDHLREIEMSVRSIENGTRTVIHNGMNAGHLHIQSAKKDYAMTVAALVVLKDPLYSDAIFLAMLQPSEND